MLLSFEPRMQQKVLEIILSEVTRPKHQLDSHLILHPLTFTLFTFHQIAHVIDCVLRILKFGDFPGAPRIRPGSHQTTDDISLNNPYNSNTHINCCGETQMELVTFSTENVRYTTRVCM